MKACTLLFFLGMMERRLNSTTTSFAEQTELLVPFQTLRTAATKKEQTELLVSLATFHTAAVKEAQTELIIPFWTIPAAEKEEEQMKLFILFRAFHTAINSFERNSSLRRWIEAHEYSLKSS